jgi:DNA polymerase III delta subunit
MITVLTGTNNFEISRAQEKLSQEYSGEISRVDGEDIALDKLIELVSSTSLFSTKRMVIIRDLSSNKPIWTALGERLDAIDDDVHLVLIEPSVDKRTATYKRLQKVADVRLFTLWSDRDGLKAEEWVNAQAKQLGITMDKKSVQTLVARVGMDQWDLYHGLEKLAVLDHVDVQVIEEIIEAQASENVFNLLDAALRGNTERVSEMIRHLQRTQDPYMTFGLLSAQVFQLAALAVANKPSAEVAVEIGAHPYALSKLAPQAKLLGRNGTRSIVKIFADTDSLMKSTATEPWILIEQALIRISL